MTLEGTVHQKLGSPPGPARTRKGEPRALPVGDEAQSGRHDPKDTGNQRLLDAALVSGNLARAWRRVKANKGSAGIDGRSITDTAICVFQRSWTLISI